MFPARMYNCSWAVATPAKATAAASAIIREVIRGLL
jgi:hypothetical protein